MCLHWRMAISEDRRGIAGQCAPIKLCALCCCTCWYLTWYSPIPCLAGTSLSIPQPQKLRRPHEACIDPAPEVDPGLIQPFEAASTDVASVVLTLH